MYKVLQHFTQLFLKRKDIHNYTKPYKIHNFTTLYECLHKCYTTSQQNAFYTPFTQLFTILQNSTKLFYKHLHNSTRLYNILQNLYNTLQHFIKLYKSFTKLYQPTIHNSEQFHKTLQNFTKTLQNFTKLTKHHNTLQFYKDSTTLYTTSHNLYKQQIITILYNTLQSISILCNT